MNASTTDPNRAVACIRFVRRLRVHWTSVEWLRECSIDEIEDGERWQRWETIFAIIKFKSPRRHGEPRFYKWRYDGRPHWNLSLGSTRIQWGCDHEDMYVGWAARILDNHSTRDRILDNNLAGVWKTKCKSAERAVEDMRVALIKCVHFTRIIGELHQPSIEDTEDVDHILSNGDCRRVREAYEAAMAALETHPPDDMEPDYFGKILPEGERLCIQCGKIHRTDEACPRNENDSSAATGDTAPPLARDRNA